MGQSEFRGGWWGPHGVTFAEGVKKESSTRKKVGYGFEKEEGTVWDRVKAGVGAVSVENADNR